MGIVAVFPILLFLELLTSLPNKLLSVFLARLNLVLGLLKLFPNLEFIFDTLLLLVNTSQSSPSHSDCIFVFISFISFLVFGVFDDNPNVSLKLSPIDEKNDFEELFYFLNS